MTDWKSSLRSDPIPWLLDNACPATRYRVMTELMEMRRDDPDVKKARAEAFEYQVGAQLQRLQRKDGSWGGNIHAGDSRKYTASLENSLWRLFEFGSRSAGWRCKSMVPACRICCKMPCAPSRRSTSSRRCAAGGEPSPAPTAS